MAAASSLPWDKMPADVRETYVLTGYRPVSMGIFASLRSGFFLHNETLNIWTHMLPVFYFLYFLWLDAEMWIEMDLPHDQRFPLYGYILGICILFGTSGCAHWLNCVSWHWRHVFFMLDYGAISVYGVATAVAYYFYCHSKTPMISNGTGYFLPCTVIAAIFATWMCCWTRVNHDRVPNVCHVIRTLSFALPFLIGSLPAIARFLGPYLSKVDVSLLPSPLQQTIANHSHLTGDSDVAFQHHYVRHFVLLCIGAFIHMAKVPERWFPGYFDIFGHSHQWFHLFVFLSIREQFWLVIGDIRDGRQEGTLYSSISTLSTIMVYSFLVMMVLATISWFSQYTGDEVPDQSESVEYHNHHSESMKPNSDHTEKIKKHNDHNHVDSNDSRMDHLNIANADNEKADQGVVTPVCEHVVHTSTKELDKYPPGLDCDSVSNGDANKDGDIYGEKEVTEEYQDLRTSHKVAAQGDSFPIVTQKSPEVRQRLKASHQ